MSKPNCTCDTCGTSFYKKPSRIASSRNNYCTRMCQNKAQIKGEVKQCLVCGKDTYKAQAEIRKNKTGQFFCSKKCQAVEQNAFGELANNFKGEDVKDYRVKAFRYNEHKCARCGYDNEVKILQVHHKDGVHCNNELSNLEILCPNCHCIEHFVT